MNEGLEGEGLEKKRGLEAQAGWRRNESARGAELQAGERDFSLGLIYVTWERGKGEKSPCIHQRRTFDLFHR